MRTRLRAVWVMAIVLLTAGAWIPAVTADAKPARDPALRSVLLRVHDLPSSFTPQATTDADDDFLCGIDPTGVMTAAAFEDAIFSSAGGYGAYVYSAVARYEGERAAETIREVSSRKGCTTTTPAGAKQVTRIRVLPVPRIGDESVAFRVLQTGGPLSPFAFDTVLVRKGDLVAAVSTFSLVGRPPSPVALARKVGTRLASLS